ncbi:hypothetical protein PAMP_015208 [Pampus punctatissimus]
MLMNCAARSHVCGGLRAADSIACRAACSRSTSGEAGAAAAVSRKRLWKTMNLCPSLRLQEEYKKLFVQKEVLLHQLMKPRGVIDKDLRHYLNLRFQKGSVDHELQQIIRDNLYLRTVPYDKLSHIKNDKRQLCPAGALFGLSFFGKLLNMSDRCEDFRLSLSLCLSPSVSLFLSSHGLLPDTSSLRFYHIAMETDVMSVLVCGVNKNIRHSDQIPVCSPLLNNSMTRWTVEKGVKKNTGEAQIDLRLSLCGQPHRKCLCNGFYTSAVKADEDPALLAASVNTVDKPQQETLSPPFNPCPTPAGFNEDRERERTCSGLSCLFAAVMYKCTPGPCDITVGWLRVQRPQPATPISDATSSQGSIFTAVICSSNTPNEQKLTQADTWITCFIILDTSFTVNTTQCTYIAGTTRQPKEGEVPGVDYNFVTVDRFMELEKSGALLESGTYEDNFYGTPKPPAEPSALLLNVTDKLLPGARPSSEGKRKRNKSVSNMEKASIEPPEEEEDERPVVNGNGVAVTPESSEHEDKSTDASGDIAPQSNPAEAPVEVPKDEEQSLKMAIPKPEENDELGPLPDNWEMAYTEKGEVYFIDCSKIVEVSHYIEIMELLRVSYLVGGEGIPQHQDNIVAGPKASQESEAARGMQRGRQYENCVGFSNRLLRAELSKGEKSCLCLIKWNHYLCNVNHKFADGEIGCVSHMSVKNDSEKQTVTIPRHSTQYNSPPGTKSEVQL